MQTMIVQQAVAEALAEEMRRDPRVVMFGEGVATKRPELLAEFGAERVRNTPLAEAIITGTAVGAAAMGLRPVVDLLFAPFLTLSMDALINSAGKLRYLSGGQFSFPLVVLAMSGAGWGVGGQHNHNLEAMFVHAPGLKVVMPATARDAKGLLAEAIRDPDPVLFCEPLRGYRLISDEVPEEDYTVELGRARVAREGTDLVIVAYSAAVVVAEQAAERAAEEGYSVGVLDLRSLVPLDVDALREAVAACGRAVVLHEGSLSAGFGAELVATIQEEAFFSLHAPIGRVAAYDTPYPPGTVEDRYVPSVDRVLAAVRAALEG